MAVVGAESALESLLQDGMQLLRLCSVSTLTITILHLLLNPQRRNKSFRVSCEMMDQKDEDRGNIRQYIWMNTG